jgi:hypothetical protein
MCHAGAYDVSIARERERLVESVDPYQAFRASGSFKSCRRREGHSATPVYIYQKSNWWPVAKIQYKQAMQQHIPRLL